MNATTARETDSRTAGWSAIFAVCLVPLSVVHPAMALAAALLTVLAGSTAWRQRDWAAMRVVVLVLILLVLSLLATPFPIWFAVAAIWLAGRWVTWLRPEKGWLPAGEPNRATIWLTAVTVIVAGLALTVWATTVDRFGEATTELAETLSETPIALLIPLLVLFVVANAVTEEIAYRVLVFDVATSVMPRVAAVLVQAVAFGLLHIRGFPAGVTGVVLATLYGLSLGILRSISGGLRAPVIAHLAADTTIAVLFILVVVPQAT